MTASEFLARSKRIEEAATPIVRSGLDFGWVEWSGDGPALCGPAIETHREDGADAEFIAHAYSALPRMREALEAVLALHARETRFSDPAYPEESWSTEGECRMWRENDDGELLTFDICVECGRIEQDDFDADDRPFRESLWPCPTVRAIESALAEKGAEQ